MYDPPLYCASIYKSGTQYLLHNVRREVGIETGLTHVGFNRVVPPFWPMVEGKKVVIPWIHPALHVLSRCALDMDHSLHAYPVILEWAKRDNVLLVNGHPPDREAELEAVAKFLDIPQSEWVGRWRWKAVRTGTSRNHFDPHRDRFLDTRETPDYMLAEFERYGLNDIDLWDPPR